jgi:hypothetical protein
MNRRSLLVGSALAATAALAVRQQWLPRGPRRSRRISRAAVLRCDRYERTPAVVRDGLKLLAPSVRGKRVLLKPNLVEYSQAAPINTHPILIASTVDALYMLGAASVINVTLAEFGEKYIEYAKLHKRSWKRDVQMLGHLQTFFGPCKLRELTPLRIEEYQQARLKQDTAPATSNRELALLKHMFFVAERWGQHQGANPVPAGQIPTGEQPPFFNSQRGRGATAAARLTPVSARLDPVCDQHRSENERYF